MIIFLVLCVVGLAWSCVLLREAILASRKRNRMGEELLNGRIDALQRQNEFLKRLIDQRGLIIQGQVARLIEQVNAVAERVGR